METNVPHLRQHDAVFVLDLGDGENRFHPDWVAEVHSALDTAIDAARGGDPTALVTTASGKFYSNGLDLDWVTSHPKQHKAYIANVEHLFARVLAAPMVTVSAIQGHAFAAGAMLTLAHDFRVMRADRGFWCLPEIDINIPFTPGMSALIQSRLAPDVAHEAMITGRRYGGDQAAAARIIDHTAAEDLLRSTALDIAQAHASKAGDTLETIKERAYASTLATLRSTTHPTT